MSSAKGVALSNGGSGAAPGARASVSEDNSPFALSGAAHPACHSHDHPPQFHPTRRSCCSSRPKVAPDASRVHRCPAERRTWREADDVQFEDVRVHQVPRQLQDGRRQARSAPARPGPLQQLPRRGRGRRCSDSTCEFQHVACRLTPPLLRRRHQRPLRGPFFMPRRPCHARWWPAHGGPAHAPAAQPSEAAAGALGAHSAQQVATRFGEMLVTPCPHQGVEGIGACVVQRHRPAPLAAPKFTLPQRGCWRAV